MSRRLDPRSGVTRRHVLALMLALAGCAPPVSNATAEAHPVGSAQGDDAGPDADQPSDTDDDDVDDEEAPYMPDQPPLDPDDEPDATTDDPTPSSDGGPSGWTPTGDGGTVDPWPDPDSDGGVSNPGDCRVLAHNTDSGPFGTTGPVCFSVAAQPPNAWAAYHMDGRTVTINGTPVSVGQLPFPGGAPFIVEFSAGTFDYTAWSYW